MKLIKNKFDGYIHCDLCRRESNGFILWYLEHLGFKNLFVCQECNLSVSEQFQVLFEEVKEK